MNKDYCLFDIDKIKFEYVGDPINRNESINQIKIIVPKIYVRSSPSVNSKIVGYIRPGIYNYTEIQQSDGYSWYLTDIGWIPYSDEWAVAYENLTLKQEDSSNQERKQIKILQIINNFIKKVFKRI